MHSVRAFRRHLAVVSAILLTILVAAPALAHEARTVNGYDFEVGLINEPVFVGDKSGLELFVHKDDQPVADLDRTVTAQVLYNGQARDLPLIADDEVPGRYFSAFIPTAAGKYTFHLKGALPDGSTFDESFTSSPTGFNEVQEVAAGQFPVQFPSQADLAAQAKKGSDAASQMTIALALGGLGVLLGLAALGVAVAGRSRTH